MKFYGDDFFKLCYMLLTAPSAFKMICPLSASGPLGRGANHLERYGGPVMKQCDSQFDDQQSKISASSQEPLIDEAKPISQEEIRRLYLEQQRRLACPGCGEEPFLG